MRCCKDSRRSAVYLSATRLVCRGAGVCAVLLWTVLRVPLNKRGCRLLTLRPEEREGAGQAEGELRSRGRGSCAM